MGVTATIKRRNICGQQKVNTFDIVPDNSWAGSGEPLSAAQVGLSVIEHAEFNQTGGYVWRYDASLGVINAYRQTDPQAIGGADIPLVAVSPGVNLSALTVRAMFWGR